MKKQDLIESLSTKNFSDRILNAFESVDRKKFVPGEYKDCAYEDVALPIGHDQTISQPQTIAFMLELLGIEEEQKILEIGSGSGYVLALLAEIAPKSRIYGTEIIPELLNSSKEKLSEHKNIKIFQAGNKLGLPEKAPFDRILVSASAEKLPEELFLQLREYGILVCPVLNSIIKAEKSDGRILREEHPGFSFVKLKV